MALKKKPVTGMKDMLPREMQIRDYVIRLIKETYGTFGLRHHVWSISRTCRASKGERMKS